MNSSDYLISLTESSACVSLEFSSLSIDQLNWKPHPEKWSIGQCLDHIITTNSTYFPVFESVVHRKYMPGLWVRMSPFSNYFGNLLARTLGPERKKAYRSPKVFRPSQASILPEITTVFESHNRELIARVNKIIELELEDVVIHSPASYFVTYTIFHAIAIIARHEERHLKQALELKSML